MFTNKKYTIQLSKEEIAYLDHILWHFTDYMAYDDRPDHGLGILKHYRKVGDEKKFIIYRLAGKLRRKYRKIVNNNIKTI